MRAPVGIGFTDTQASVAFAANCVGSRKRCRHFEKVVQCGGKVLDSHWNLRAVPVSERRKEPQCTTHLCHERFRQILRSLGGRPSAWCAIESEKRVTVSLNNTRKGWLALPVSGDFAAWSTAFAFSVTAVEFA